jgi:subtilisin family serine protease
MVFFRSKKSILFIFFILIVSLVGVSLLEAIVPNLSLKHFLISSQNEITKDFPNYIEGEVLVVFEQGVDSTVVRSFADRYLLTIKKNYPAIARIQGKEIVLLKSELRTTDQMVLELEGLPEVESVSPNFERIICQTHPNDPFYSLQWALHNTGQSGGTPDIDIDAPEAWDYTTGNSIIVGVIDTGVDYNHEDLMNNMWQNPGETPGNGVDDDGNGFVDDVYGINAITMTGDPNDDHGHGTHCAGIVGGAGNNDTGAVGVNWIVRIIAAKFLSDAGIGYDSDAITCLDYLMDLKTSYGHEIIVTNNSWGGGGYNAALKSAIDASGTAGIVFCAAAGHAGTDNDITPHYPASYSSSNIIAVTAVDHDGNQLYNYGASSVDIAAPGESILSCVPTWFWGPGSPPYGYASGTSSATPHITGAVALVASLFPSETVAQRITRILSSVMALPSLGGKCVTEGMLNLYSALIYSPNPEMNVRFRSINLADGSTTNLGTRPSSLIMGRAFTFTIENLGALQLNLTGSPRVTLSGPQAAHFYISQQPISPIAAYGSTTFKLRTVRDSLPGFLPIGWTYPGSITITIPNDDADENPYDFTINFTLEKDS